MTVITERRGHVFLIGVNRPEKRNAFNLEVIDGFSRAYEELGNDPDLRVGVVYAVGDHFSAGLDLAEVGAKVAEVGPGALAYALNADGSLAVVDSRGWKRTFLARELQALSQKCVKLGKRSAE